MNLSGIGNTAANIAGSLGQAANSTREESGTTEKAASGAEFTLSASVDGAESGSERDADGRRAEEGFDPTTDEETSADTSADAGQLTDDTEGEVSASTQRPASTNPNLGSIVDLDG